MKSLICVAALLVMTSGVAYAHAELSGSMPADQAVLEAAPKELMLHFTEEVRLTTLSIRAPGGEKQDLGPLPASMGRDFTVAAPSLEAGDYVVSWRALSEDTHVMTGEFKFTVQGGNASHAQHSAH
ncbi:MAG TPA: copper resistance CopC family protein [Hyphomicrobiaceae bacterium]